MNLDQIDHVALTCASPEASRDWYVRVLGFTQVHPGLWGGRPIFLSLGSTSIALFPCRGDQAVTTPPGIRFHHLALRAKTHADFETAQRELSAQGIAFQFQDHEISHSIYFADPDGHHLEITTYDLPARNRAG